MSDDAKWSDWANSLLRQRNAALKSEVTRLGAEAHHAAEKAAELLKALRGRMRDGHASDCFCVGCEDARALIARIDAKPSTPTTGGTP